MPKITEVPWQRFEKFLIHSGCRFTRKKGSHRAYWKEGLSRPVILQAKGKVPVFIIKKNLQTLGIGHDEYLRVLAQV
jgi:predicted RNA binding protein YcfA (HicA-like mRNA interferase family)